MGCSKCGEADRCWYGGLCGSCFWASLSGRSVGDLNALDYTRYLRDTIPRDVIRLFKPGVLKGQPAGALGKPLEPVEPGEQEMELRRTQEALRQALAQIQDCTPQGVQPGSEAELRRGEMWTPEPEPEPEPAIEGDIREVEPGEIEMVEHRLARTQQALRRCQQRVEQLENRPKEVENSGWPTEVDDLRQRLDDEIADRRGFENRLGHLRQGWIQGLGLADRIQRLLLDAGIKSLSVLHQTPIPGLRTILGLSDTNVVMRTMESLGFPLIDHPPGEQRPGEMELKGKLQELQQALRDCQRANRLLTSQPPRACPMEEVEELQQELTDVRGTLGDTSYRLDKLRQGETLGLGLSSEVEGRLIKANCPRLVNIRCHSHETLTALLGRDGADEVIAAMKTMGRPLEER